MKPANFKDISRSRSNRRLGGVDALFIALLLSVFSAQAATDIYTASGTWTAPAGVTSVDVEVWGGGGFYRSFFSRHPVSGRTAGRNFLDAV